MHYYISTNGDDRADGKTPETAWRSFSRAMETAGAGDTVHLLAGAFARDGATEARIQVDGPGVAVENVTVKLSGL